MLNIQTSATLTEPEFHKASSVIITYLYQLPRSCSMPKLWNEVTYQKFVDELIAIPEPVDGHNTSRSTSDSKYFNLQQLKTLLRTISLNYLPGNWSLRQQNNTFCPQIKQKTESNCLFGNLPVK